MFLCAGGTARCPSSGAYNTAHQCRHATDTTTDSAVCALLVAPCLQEVSALQPDLIIGDATASFGHWLTALTGVPSIEFDVGSSSGLLHSMHGGQFNPAYVPAPGEPGCVFVGMQNWQAAATAEQGLTGLWWLK